MRASAPVNRIRPLLLLCSLTVCVYACAHVRVCVCTHLHMCARVCPFTCIYVVLRCVRMHACVHSMHVSKGQRTALLLVFPSHLETVSLLVAMYTRLAGLQASGILLSLPHIFPKTHVLLYPAFVCVCVWGGPLGL